MRTITALYRYPVKGLSPEPLQAVPLQAGLGFPRDREWAVTNGRWTYDAAQYAPRPKTDFLMLMQHEQLAALRTKVSDDGRRLAVQAPDGTALDLALDDEADLARPQRWDMGFIRDFMLRIGPISSVFDFLTFFILLGVLHASPAEFHTGWFVESLATQVLVIFIIRTRGNPLASRSNRWLALTSLGVVALAIALPFTPIASVLGFTPLPPAFFALLPVLVVLYLGVVELAKRRFHRRWALRHSTV